MTGALLELDRVSKRFTAGGRSVEALHEVSLQVAAGRITGLVGPDGAGKTTLMRIAAALLLPDAGTVHVLGADAVADPLAVQAQVGYMPQRFGLYEDLTVQENLDLYADLHGIDAARRAARFAELTQMTALGDFTGRLAGRLSGGMKQKLGLACALLRAPRLLLLDEPTVGVDPLSRRELWAIVARLVADEGVGVLLSTAYLDEAERCAEVVLLHQGDVLGAGPPGDFAAAMGGRSWRLKVAGSRPRQVQGRLAGRPGVIDAVVQGEAVRLIGEQAGQPPVTGDANAVPEPVPPRFEDGFIARLVAARGQPPAAAAEHPRRREIADPVIAVDRLSRRFGDFTAVRGLTFDVHRGEVFGLLGANGAGKSTTFRMLCGLLPPSAGRLQVAGVDLRRAPADARARIGYMSQKFSLYGNLSVRQNLAFFASAYGLGRHERAARVDAAVSRFGLNDLLDNEAVNLPLGHKQRLAMACALLPEPDVLFLDEPTSGVDPLARREFWGLINSLAEAGVTVLVTTHFMEEAEYCDRLAILVAGGLLALGTPAEVKARAGLDADAPMEEAFVRLVSRPESAA